MGGDPKALIPVKQGFAPLLPEGEGGYNVFVNHMKMSRKKREFARDLRKDSTDYENLIWEQLKNRKCFGLKFRRQHVIEGFVVDFYCHELRLAIELDGMIHRAQKDYDEWRDEQIGAEGIYIMRIQNTEIDLDSMVVKKMVEELLKKKNHKAPGIPLALRERGIIGGEG